jgi:hypothetical protein
VGINRGARGWGWRIRGERFIRVNDLSEAEMRNDEENPWRNPPQYGPFPKNGIHIDGETFYSQEEIDELYRKRAEATDAYIQKLRERWLATPQGQLCLEFYRKFQEYKEYLESILCQPSTRRCSSPNIASSRRVCAW